MALGRKRSRERRQRATRWLWRVSQTVMVLLVFLGFGILTYRGAEEMARAEVTALETRLAEATERESTAAVVQSRLAGELAEARTESSTWRDLSACCRTAWRRHRARTADGSAAQHGNAAPL